MEAEWRGSIKRLGRMEKNNTNKKHIGKYYEQRKIRRRVREKKNKWNHETKTKIERAGE